MLARDAEDFEAQRALFFEQTVQFLQRSLTHEKHRPAAIEAFGTLMVAVHGNTRAPVLQQFLFAYLRKALTVRSRSAVESRAVYVCLALMVPVYKEEIAEPLTSLFGLNLLALLFFFTSFFNGDCAIQTITLSSSRKLPMNW